LDQAISMDDPVTPPRQIRRSGLGQQLAKREARERLRMHAEDQRSRECFSESVHEDRERFAMLLEDDSSWQLEAVLFM
jgi:hypothetical protein